MPKLLTTMAGSLPFDSIDEAVEYALMHDIPAVPELPKLDGDMIQCAINGKRPSAYERFCDAAKKQGVKSVKVQGAGPVTLEVYGRMSWRDALNKSKTYFESLLCDLDFADNIYVCLDEPAIGREFPSYHTDTIKAVMGKILFRRNFIPMIHSCNDVSDRVGYFDELGFKVVSFDATKYNVKYAGGSLRVEYWKFRENGGVLCFGAVSIMDRFGVSQFSPSDARDGDMISHSCGFGNLSIDDCYKGRRILQDIKDALR